MIFHWNYALFQAEEECSTRSKLSQLTEEASQAVRKRGNVCEFALPNRGYTPARLFQKFLVSSITVTICLDLGSPEVQMRFWQVT